MDTALAFRDLRYQKKVRTREELLKHLNDFSLDIKMSVGMWTFSPGGGRFHEKYGEDIPVPERIKMLYDMAEYGVKGIEAHYGWEISEDNIDQYKQVCKDTGMEIIMAGTTAFYPKDFEFGSLSNPVPAKRKLAQYGLIEVLRFAAKHGIPCTGVWPGIDGYTYPIGTPFYQMWELYESTMAEALDQVPGMRINIEPKPYEPIPNNIYRTTSDGILLCQDVEKRLKHPTNTKLLAEGHALLAMQPEIGHVAMGFEDTPYAFMRIARQGRLSHTHWNSQPLGNYDQDLNVGVVAWDQAEALMYALKSIGYTGYFGIDINPERMPITKAVEVNWKVLNIMRDRVDSLPHERILECYYEPYEHRGDLELIIAESKR
jgi:xylose isomerase